VAAISIARLVTPGAGPTRKQAGWTFRKKLMQFSRHQAGTRRVSGIHSRTRDRAGIMK
jgi:hypothetical protein